MLGALIGPDGLGLAEVDDILEFLGQLGLGFLFFFAGYEIDFERIRGTPLRLAVLGWLITLALAYGLAGLLAAAGVVLSGLLVGSALTTTALGTLLPVLRDEGELETNLGRYVLGAGAVGEFGPVLIVTLLLSTQSDTANQLLLLTAFTLLAVLAAAVSVGAVGRGWRFIESQMETSGQVPVRLTVLLLFGLVVMAAELGLDVILGAFAAGAILRLLLRGREVERFESKLDAVGFGLLIPFFFVTSGMTLDLSALVEQRPRPDRAARVPAPVPRRARDPRAAPLPPRARRERSLVAGAALGHGSSRSWSRSPPSGWTPATCACRPPRRSSAPACSPS